MRPTKDLTGQKYGLLAVLSPSVSKGYWLAQCDCGTQKVVRGASLLSGNTRSCGCLIHSNPGRPKRPRYSAHIPLGTFVQDTFENMTPLRNALARQGVIINSKGELRYADRTEHYADAYEALAHALLKCVQHNRRKS